MIHRCISEVVDPVLIDREPIRATSFLADVI
jgi:hypothetical protein